MGKVIMSGVVPTLEAPVAAAKNTAVYTSDGMRVYTLDGKAVCLNR